MIVWVQNHILLQATFNLLRHTKLLYYLKEDLAHLSANLKHQSMLLLLHHPVTDLISVM
jgi:hypothetical protein